MAEYIHREVLKGYIKSYGKGAIEGRRTRLDPADDIVAIAGIVDLMPAADVVEVVRCREYKYYEIGKDYLPYCNHPESGLTDYPQPHDFDADSGYGVVELYDGAFEVANDDWVGTFHENYKSSLFEIIGNIHDNLELLEAAP